MVVVMMIITNDNKEHFFRYLYWLVSQNVYWACCSNLNWQNKKRQLGSSHIVNRTFDFDKHMLTLISSVNGRLQCNRTNKRFGTEQCFLMVLFIILCDVGLSCKSANEILKCDNSNESYRAVRLCGTVCYAVQGGSNFCVCGWYPKVW